MEKLNGPSMCGFDDLFDGHTTLVGAGKPTAPGKPTTPKKPPLASDAYKKAAGIKPSAVVANHGKVLNSAVQTAKHTGNQLASAIKTFAAKPVAKTSTVVTKKPTAPSKTKVTVHGDSVLGVSVAASKKLTPKAKAALQKLGAANKKKDAASATLLKAIKVAKPRFDDLHKKIASQRSIAKSIQRKRVSLHGLYDDEALLGVDAYGLYPGDPGYDPTTDPSAGSADPNASLDQYADPSGTVSNTPDLDPADLANLPPAPSMDTVTADYNTVGGIPYDFSKGKPPGFLVSLFLADPGNQSTGGIKSGIQNGYLFGGNNTQSGWPGEDPSQWINAHGHRGGSDWWSNAGGWDVTAQVVADSQARGNMNKGDYGPIVGNPMMPDFKALRVDRNGIPFWYPQEAPDFVTAPLKQAAALTANAAKQAAAAAQAASDAANAKAAADAAAAQAAQDAANALAESQAVSEANVAEAQGATTQAQTTAAQAQTDVQERQQNLEQAKAQAALDLQTAQFNAQQGMEAAKANQALALQQQQAAFAASQNVQFVEPFEAQSSDVSDDGGDGSDGGGFYEDGGGTDNQETTEELDEEAASEFDAEIDQ